MSYARVQSTLTSTGGVWLLRGLKVVIGVVRVVGETVVEFDQYYVVFSSLSMSSFFCRFQLRRFFLRFRRRFSSLSTTLFFAFLSKARFLVHFDIVFCFVAFDVVFFVSDGIGLK